MHRGKGSPQADYRTQRAKEPTTNTGDHTKYNYRLYLGIIPVMSESSGNFSIILFAVARSLIDFIQKLSPLLSQIKLRSISDRLWQKRKGRNDNCYDNVLRVSE